MKHLTDTELVDVLDTGHRGTQARTGSARGLPGDRLRHLEMCEACRIRADALRDAVAEMLVDEAPEPSPLFWDFFAARVSDAIGRESPGAPAAASAVAEWRRHPLTQWAMAASIATLVMMAVVWRATLHAPPPAGPSSGVLITAAARGAVVDTALAVVPTPDDVEKDAAWAVVRTAAEGLRWEDAHAIGITAGPGSAEGLALELTAAERAELARLIDTELKRSGA